MKCKKLIYKNPSGTRNNVILGIIIKEDSSFIHFKTARKNYKIHQQLVLSVSDTDEAFLGGK